MPTTDRPRRLLTVCLGNHCRSPLAAVVLADLGGQAVQVRSAGTRDRWQDQPAHRLMVVAAARRGHDLTAHRGAQVTDEMLDWADVVLAMDHSILTTLQKSATDEQRNKMTLYLPDGQDVPDPFGRDQAAFDECAAIIAAAASHHLP
ncbi:MULTISPECIES: hypothetical protein [Actinosynnema]|uniref:arsenate reductase/protein-tyrosine-phosphatase family protein n=1 Tax=Actinosynnema TaxID=40566 RepID=UPI0020A459BD|nr:hypothetical protein [Actinosynnema pretiosum]